MVDGASHRGARQREARSVNANVEDPEDRAPCDRAGFRRARRAALAPHPERPTACCSTGRGDDWIRLHPDRVREGSGYRLHAPPARARSEALSHRPLHRHGGRVGQHRRLRRRWAPRHLHDAEPHRGEEPALSEQRQPHLHRCGGPRWARRPQRARRRRLHGRGVGRLRQRRASRHVPLPVGEERALPEQWRGDLHRRHRARRARPVDECEQRDVVRLRQRRPPRSLRRRLFPRAAEPRPALHYTHPRQQLRVRDEWRAELSLPQSG